MKRASTSSRRARRCSRPGSRCWAACFNSRCPSSSPSSSSAMASRSTSAHARALERLAGERGQRLVVVATLTVRGVVVGILGTALAQGVLMAIGSALVGIKAAPLLGLVTFFLSPVPIGPPLVWIPTGLWLISQGATGCGHLPAAVGIAGRVDGRQRAEAADHQPRQRPAVRPRPAGHSGWRRRVRLHRRVPRARADRGLLRAAQGMGRRRAVGGDRGERSSVERFRRRPEATRARRRAVRAPGRRASARVRAASPRETATAR